MSAATNHSQPPGIRGMFERFLHSQVTASVLLLACAVIALIWANVPDWQQAYDDLLHIKVGVSWGEQSFKLTLHHFVNDGLMAIFFFVVGLEIKRELLTGELSTARKAALPAAAALGGMVVPAAIYAALNFGGEGAAGWGIPMATDIAFALGILAVFGKRVPIGLKVFLTALAIVDDLGAVLVIALFYTEQISVGALITAFVLLGLLGLMTRIRFRRYGVVGLIVLGVWAAVLASGVHATIAGILVAMVVPVRARMEPSKFLELSYQKLEKLGKTELTIDSMLTDQEQWDAIVDLSESTSAMRPAGLDFERYLHPAVAYLILPIFALFNAGVTLGGETGGEIVGRISLGVILGLFIGKQIGVTLASWIVIKMGLASRPEGVTWKQIHGAACLAGVGFTMSLFIAELAFKGDAGAALLSQAKIGILCASLISGIVGAAFIWSCVRKHGPDGREP